MEKDLLGRKIRRRKTKLQIALERYDRNSFDERLARLRWLARVFPDKYAFLGPPETLYIFDEAKNTFTDGAYVSTILLCTSFIEHWLSSVLSSRGYDSDAKGGLNSIVKCLKRQRLAHDFLIKRIDRLRELRNPFAHLKPPEHPHRITHRAVSEARHPMQVLEDDAKNAVSLMYAVATRIH
jgi:HEPN domain